MPQATVLIAEDDANLAEILKTKLSALGYNVFVAHEGDETEKLMMEQKPDLSLLDIMMPKKSGLEVLESISKLPDAKEMPVMMMSNLGQKKDIDKADSLGAKDYIVKANSSLADIVKKIEDFLKTHPAKERPEAPKAVSNRASNGSNGVAPAPVPVASVAPPAPPPQPPPIPVLPAASPQAATKPPIPTAPQPVVPTMPLPPGAFPLPFPYPPQIVPQQHQNGYSMVYLIPQQNSQPPPTPVQPVMYYLVPVQFPPPTPPQS